MLFLKQPVILPFLCNKSASTCPIDLNKAHFISFHFMIFIQGKYSSHVKVDLQTALLQTKSYKITVMIKAILKT